MVRPFNHINMFLINLVEASRPFTAFSFEGIQYMYNRACFGLKNAPAVFNRWFSSILMKAIERQYYERFVDDLNIHTMKKDINLHVKLLHKTLTAMRENYVYANASKMHWFVEQIPFGGSLISHKAIRPLYDIAQAVLTMPPPQTISEMRSFLGSINFYRHFLGHVGPQIHRLSEFTKGKVKKIKLSPTDIKDFDDIKNALCADTVLMNPHYDRPFHVYTDASDVGSGLMIAQEDDNKRLRPILFDSRKFDSAQKNYDTKDRELLAVVHAVEKYDYLLRSRPFILYTDHKNMVHFRLYQDSGNSRHVRWGDLLSRYNYSTQFIEGEKNCMADYLSRTPSFYNPWSGNLLNEIIKSYTLSQDVSTSNWFSKMKIREDVVHIDNVYYWIHNDTKRAVVLNKDHIKLLNWLFGLSLESLINGKVFARDIINSFECSPSLSLASLSYTHSTTDNLIKLSLSTSSKKEEREMTTSSKVGGCYFSKIVIIEFIAVCVVAVLFTISAMSYWYQTESTITLYCRGQYTNPNYNQTIYLKTNYLLEDYEVTEDEVGSWAGAGVTNCGYSQQDLPFEPQQYNMTSGDGNCLFFNAIAYLIYSVTPSKMIELTRFLSAMMWISASLGGVAIIFISIYKCFAKNKKNHSVPMTIFWALVFVFPLMTIFSFIDFQKDVENPQFIFMSGSISCTFTSAIVTSTSYMAGFIMAITTLFPSFGFFVFRLTRKLKKLSKNNKKSSYSIIQ
ncbi:hypothetical protein DFA_07990 [Cavenderia fasciculata]|uniref:Reverse transcriptase/retrotransposon-derived protein RNase H-like domain-containing protein n=1 Tax=Cavenderia fasciculata TaxID=261658 RepID=F4Q4E7_CACFS|nr:uncharacterized protein DFA_07990 [Cavenderia fasciculata]EGG17009.1 hypothetical protein DFA_07990 [Cavenderia fasciculata]|eukprot:XP_004355493.1 hypothetical protein DFA_07990 [Cavenderia fasciculata]